MIPALTDATHDRALRGMPLVIYLHLIDGALDVRDFRTVKQLALAFEIGCSAASVRRALAVLVERNYLERAPVNHTEARSYRLTYSRQASPAAIPNLPELAESA